MFRLLQALAVLIEPDPQMFFNRVTGMVRPSCAFCGLPVFAAATVREGESLFCCHGCRLVTRIVGAKGEYSLHSWNLLRFGVGALLSMNVMMLSLLLYAGSVDDAWVTIFKYLIFALASPAFIIIVYPFVAGSISELRQGRGSLDTLISVGSLAAFGVSAANTLRGTGHIFFDTATMLPLLVSLGKLLETEAKTRTNNLMRELENLLPDKALRVSEHGVEQVTAAEISQGDLLRVLPGERIPADGSIISGESEIGEGAFTGEWGTRPCVAGDGVFAGTVNGSGLLEIRVTRVGEDLLLNKIVSMTDNARVGMQEAERLVERASRLFIPFVLLVASIAGVFWAMTDPVKGGMVALAVVVVACPCALGIATPLAASLALRRALKAGIFIRGGDVLERVGEIDTFFFDKTGTITTNDPSVKEVMSFDPTVDEYELLGWLATLESGSEHALAKAIMGEAREKGVEIGSVIYAKAFPGQGIRGMVTWRGSSREVLAGTANFVEPLGDVEHMSHESCTIINVAWGEKIRGRLLVNNMVRNDAAEAVSELHSFGVDTVLLSGDNHRAARAISNEVGILQVEAPRRPDEKIEIIRKAAGKGCVAMVGDGINDAPALAAADVGIAVGSGTDLAGEAAKIILLHDQLRAIPWLMTLSKGMRRIMKQNLMWAFGYNAIMISIAAAGLLHPLLAAIAMVISSVTVIINSHRVQSL